MDATINNIIDLFKEKGYKLYGGEDVTQLEHALQCATLAEEAGLSPALITACLLHDVGHLIHHLGHNPAVEGIDDRHEYRAIPFLHRLFDQAVTEPIKLHVLAKRYLCAVDSTYWASLSLASQRSLELQGGIFSPHQAQEFIRQPYAADAVQLRIYDDQAKMVNFPTPDLNHFLQLMQDCCRN